jgi:hypothetical protein
LAASSLGSFVNPIQSGEHTFRKGGPVCVTDASLSGKRGAKKQKNKKKRATISTYKHKNFGEFLLVIWVNNIAYYNSVYDVM